MSKEIPWLSARDINKIEDYDRFHNTKAYLKKKSGKLVYFKDQTDEIMELAEKCGYKKFNKFIEHRKEWHRLIRKIPLSYLEQIGAKLDVIEFTVEVDQEEFEKALELPFYPEYATVRMMPSVYQSIKLPADLTEEEAIEYLKDYSSKEERICWIKLKDIKTIWVYPNGNVNTSYYKPDYEIENDYLTPTLSGRKIGKSFLV